MKRNMIYMVGITMALLILLSNWPGELYHFYTTKITDNISSQLKVIGKESKQVLMPGNKVTEDIYEIQDRFSKQPCTMEQKKNKIGYLALKCDLLRKQMREPDYDIITE